jgi:hypothetical protein
MRKRRKGHQAVLATAQAEASAEARRIYGHAWASPVLLTLKEILGVSDRALAYELGVSEMMVGNYLRPPLFTPVEFKKMLERGLAPSDPATRRAATAFITKRRAKHALPAERESKALEALRRALDAYRDGLRVGNPEKVRGARSPERVYHRAALKVLKAKIGAAEMVLAFYGKAASR